MAVRYAYDNTGALATVTDSASGLKTTYYYDLTDRLIQYAETGTGHSHTVGYVYDRENKLTSLTEKINGTAFTTSYTYDDDNRVTSVTDRGITESYTYDAYGRVTQKVTKNGSATVLTETYTYRTVSGKPTGQIATHRSVSSGRTVTYTYNYDANGNITSVSDGTHTTTYVYDSANQLTRENNQADGVTRTFTYDRAGNMTAWTEYAYTTGTLGAATATHGYTYGNANWGDLLTVWNGNTITSDTIGNMLSDGTRTYTWRNGRELATVTKGGVTWTNTYNADGIRTKRTNGTTTYQYFYNGSKLSQMKIGSTVLNFAYDANGTPMAVTYGGATYYYATNIQGDVVAILNSSGTAVVTYTYDAWGNILTTTGTMASTLGAHNPLRYRGYVYDPETGLYYLQSRYYNPALGRFLNADSFASTGQGILGNNMFAYCQNNPVMRIDPSGNIDWSSLFEGVGLLSIGITACIVAATIVSGGACLPLLIVAGATFVAGGITIANGVAEVVESATEYNFMRDTVYGGDVQSYESQKLFFEVTAEAGTAMLAGFSDSPNLCFIAGTIILAEEGRKAIEEIEAGDRVWAWDEETGEVALKEVVETYVNETDELVHVFIRGEEIVTTPSHPFYSPVKGWTAAVRLRAGDILVLVNGEYVVVEKVQHEILEAPITVYNFQVKDYHTYFVSHDGVLVHNKCGMINKEATAAAKELGYSKVKGASSHGNAVFTNPNAPKTVRFITADADVHSGGVWKAADSIANLRSKATRSGTYDSLMRWIAP